MYVMVHWLAVLLHVFFKSVVSIQILKKTMNKNVKPGNKIGMVQQAKCIMHLWIFSTCGYLVFI